MDIGRNEPCHFGSGKKYKRCCLAKDEQATRPPGQDLHELDHRLFVDMGTWARRRFHMETAGAYDECPIDFGERDEHMPLFAAWVTYERKLEGRVLADWYQEERGRHLMTHERAWLTAQLASWLSVWEVVEVEPGKSIRVRDSGASGYTSRTRNEDGWPRWARSWEGRGWRQWRRSPRPRPSCAGIESW